MQNGLSVDVEDWFQVGAFERTINRDEWNGLECRVEANCDAVLQIFAEAGAKGTFFTLGWVAERYPALIRRIVPPRRSPKKSSNIRFISCCISVKSVKMSPRRRKPPKGSHRANMGFTLLSWRTASRSSARFAARAVVIPPEC